MKHRRGGGCISGSPDLWKQKVKWGGSPAHEMTLLIWRTVLPPVCGRASQPRQTATNDKNGEKFHLGTSRRSSFPVFQKVIQSHVKGSLHTLLHDTQYLLFQNGLLTLLIFLLFLFVLGAIYSHLITTLLVILTSGISFASASALWASFRASYSRTIFLRAEYKICSGV